MANEQNLKGQQMLFRCKETGFVTTAPALSRYQRGRGIDPKLREFVGVKPQGWKREAPPLRCELCGLEMRGSPWDLIKHQTTKRCQAKRGPGS